MSAVSPSVEVEYRTCKRQRSGGKDTADDWRIESKHTQPETPLKQHFIDFVAFCYVQMRVGANSEYTATFSTSKHTRSSAFQLLMHPPPQQFLKRLQGKPRKVFYPIWANPWRHWTEYHPKTSFWPVLCAADPIKDFDAARMCKMKKKNSPEAGFP